VARSQNFSFSPARVKAARFDLLPANLLLIKEMTVLKNSATVLMHIIYTYDHTKER